VLWGVGPSEIVHTTTPGRTDCGKDMCDHVAVDCKLRHWRYGS